MVSSRKLPKKGRHLFCRVRGQFSCYVPGRHAWGWHLAWLPTPAAAVTAQELSSFCRLGRTGLRSWPEISRWENSLCLPSFSLCVCINIFFKYASIQKNAVIKRKNMYQENAYSMSIMFTTKIKRGYTKELKVQWADCFHECLGGLPSKPFGGKETPELSLPTPKPLGLTTLSPFAA